MADGAIAAPEENCEYRVVLGRSLFTEARDAADDEAHADDHGDAAYTLFQYQFTPASVDASIPGLVSVDESTSATVLRGTTARSSEGGVSFKGKIAEQKDTECLLIFDGTSFRLERCGYVVSQLRHVRAAPLQRPPPSAYPAPTGKKNLLLGFARRVGKVEKTKGTRKVSAKRVDEAKSSHRSLVGVEAKGASSEETVDDAARLASGDVANDGSNPCATESPSNQRRTLDEN